ncbi:MAG: hypothetical protein IIB42_05945 [Candidatus Marinimicrobia bacterium]|nr:hypothetical protein [Candidatus Neomarinimicrobiota bacterium]
MLTHDQILAELERILRLRHYAPRTERAYVGWARRFLLYVGRSGEVVPADKDVQGWRAHSA